MACLRWLLLCIAVAKIFVGQSLVRGELCSKLDDPDNGNIAYSHQLNEGSVATYYCRSGYYLVGEENRTCQDDNTWNGSSSTCRRVCSLPNNGNISYNGGQGCDATYYCSKGYNMVPVELSCQADEKQDASAAMCYALQRNGSGMCPDKDLVIDNGVVFSGGDPITATYTCINGYYLVGEETRVCQENNTWSGRKPNCTDVVCPPGNLRNPQNGMVMLANYTPGSIATYTCQKGYQLDGESRRYCLTNKTWSGAAPICKRMCPNLMEFEFANGMVAHISRTPNSTARYLCNEKYYLVGEEIRICQENGTWSSSVPTCKRKCPDDDLDIANGTVSYNNRTLENAARYLCNDGYFLVGEEIRICQHGGTWSGNKPTCKQKCPDNDLDIANGTVSYNNRIPSSTARYSCNEEYYLVGKGIRICQEDGTWNGSKPTCKRKCPDDDLYIANGMVSYNNRMLESSARYLCNDGYFLVGEEIRICQDGGTWSGNKPTCKPQCPDPDSPDNGMVILPDGRSVNDIAIYFCDCGYGLTSGDEKITCRLVNGAAKWEGTMPNCSLLCPDIRDINNGRVDVSNYSMGGQANFSCDPGYALVGSNPLTCLDGVWSDDEPVCIIRCPELKPPKNGTMNVTGYYPNDIVTYTCDPEFELIGNSEQTCTEHGNWDCDTPKCSPLCPTLTNPCGNIIMTGQSVGDTATFSCWQGYHFINKENSEVMCEEDGKWSLGPIGCERSRRKRDGYYPRKCYINCPDPPPTGNGTMKVTGYYPGDTVSYYCNPGYNQTGNEKLTCTTHGEWEGDPANCSLITDCPILRTVENGRVEANYSVNGTAVVKCDKHFGLHENITLFCHPNGSWSGEPPDCIRMCPEPRCIAYGDYNVNSSFPGDTVNYTCHDGTEMKGNKMQTCTILGYWDGVPPRCIPLCPPLKNISCENVRCHVDMPSRSVGDTATYYCYKGYDLIEKKTLQCLEIWATLEVKWNGDHPHCQEQTDRKNRSINTSDNCDS